MGVWGQWAHDGDLFFGYLYDVIIRSHAPILWLAVFLDSRLKYAFLEPLIKFLAFVVQKLCQKYSKHVRNFSKDAGSEDADFGLVSEKILNHNNGPMGRDPGPGKGSQKHPHL